MIATRNQLIFCVGLQYRTVDQGVLQKTLNQRFSQNAVPHMSVARVPP